MRLVDLPVAVATRFPAARSIDASGCAEQKANGEKTAALSLADLAVLAHATVVDLPVITASRAWAHIDTEPRRRHDVQSRTWCSSSPARPLAAQAVRQ